VSSQVHFSTNPVFKRVRRHPEITVDGQNGNEGSIPFTRFRPLLPRALQRGTARQIMLVLRVQTTKGRKRRPEVRRQSNEGGQTSYAFRLRSRVAAHSTSL
jgi:hypothetical protein